VHKRIYLLLALNSIDLSLMFLLQAVWEVFDEFVILVNSLLLRVQVLVMSFHLLVELLLLFFELPLEQHLLLSKSSLDSHLDLLNNKCCSRGNSKKSSKSSTRRWKLITNTWTLRRRLLTRITNSSKTSQTAWRRNIRLRSMLLRAKRR
jgi:hypothetical protein